MAEYKEVFCNKCFNQTSACESCSLALNCNQSATSACESCSLSLNHNQCANDKFDPFSPATSTASFNIGSCSNAAFSAHPNDAFLSTDISIDTNENIDKVNNLEICRGPTKRTMMSEAASATSSITSLDESCSLLSSLCKSLEKHSSCSKINENRLSKLSVSCAIVSKTDCSNMAADLSGGVRSKNCHHNFMMGSKLSTSALNTKAISHELSTNKCMHDFSLNVCESQSCHQHDFNNCNIHGQPSTGVTAQASYNCNGMNVNLPSHTLTHIAPTVSKCSICHSVQCSNQHGYSGRIFDGSSSLTPQANACSQCGGQHDIGLMPHVYNPNCEIHGQAHQREHVSSTSTLSQSRDILSDSMSLHYRKHVPSFNFAGACDLKVPAFNRDFGNSNSSCQSSSREAIHHCCNQDTSIRHQSGFSKIQPNANLMPVHMASCQMNNNSTNTLSPFSNDKETECPTFSSCIESFDDGTCDRRKYSSSDTSYSTSVNKVKQLSSESTLGQHTSSKGSLNHTHNCPSHLGLLKPNVSFQQCKSHCSCSSRACNCQSSELPISINYNGSEMSINSAGISSSGCGHWCSSCQVKLKCTGHPQLASENVNRRHHVELDKEEAASYFNESSHSAVYPMKEDGAAVCKSDSNVQQASKNSLKSKVIQKFSRSKHRVPCKELSGAAIKKKKSSFPLWMVCLSLANKSPLVCPSISNVKEQFLLTEDAQTNGGDTDNNTVLDSNKSGEGNPCDAAIFYKCSEVTDSTETITTCKSQQASSTNCHSLSRQLPNSSLVSPQCYSGVSVHCSSDDEEREYNETCNSINALPDNANNCVVHQATGNVALPWTYKSMWEVQMLLERSFRFGLSGPGIVSQEQIAQQMERLNECASGDRPVSSSSKSASGGSTVSLWQQQTVHTQVDYIHCLVPDLLAITSCSFYWGKMDRYEAEGLLENRPEGTFLLRDSAQDEFLFSVSFRRYAKSLHVRIEQGNHKFSFDSRDPGVFASDTVCGLIEHYKDPSCCMFFEPILTNPLCRNFAFPLQHLCRATICSRTTYDGINKLQIPKILRNYLKEYHYKQLVGVRRLDH